MVLSTEPHSGPIRVSLREQNPQLRRWAPIFDAAATPGQRDVLEVQGAVSVAESSILQLRIYPDQLIDFQARLYVGNVLVASTLERDRPDFHLDLSPDAEPGEEYFACRGQIFRDWAGSTELEVRVQREDDWVPIVTAGLQISAGKISDAAFDALCKEIADYSAAVLLDVYGKTFIGLRPERRQGESAPIAIMQLLRQVVHQMDSVLRDIARRPACRLKTTRSRELALPDASVSELTLEEACTDPTLAFHSRRGVMFREQIHETALSDFDLRENRMLKSFLLFLQRQTTDLRNRMLREVQIRRARKSTRNVRGESGEKTWWEQEDLPRIEEMQRMLQDLRPVEEQLGRQLRHEFLPPAPILHEVPPSTPLIRAHPAYAHAYRLIQSHFQAYRVQLDDEHLLTRARSLPVLYEWWCLLAVLRVLQSCLRQVEAPGADRTTPFRRLRDERERFVVEFEANQAVDFYDEKDRLVRIRYVPRYLSRVRSKGAPYGLLGSDEERTPDIALEIYDRASHVVLPEMIIVIDAKYSSSAHNVKMDEVRRKYGKIGVFKSGSMLSRQVWAMAPTPAVGGPMEDQPDWAQATCTVDNDAFWSEEFDMRSSVTGVVQAVPGVLPHKSPLNSLLRMLLTRSGVILRTD